MNRSPVPPLRLNPDLPPRLEDIIHKALEKDRNLRYQQAADMRTVLQRLKRDSDSGRHSGGGCAVQRLLRLELRSSGKWRVPCCLGPWF